MDVNKWKSVAVDIETYSIIRAMGENGFRRPGAMIAKLADNEVKKLAKKLGVSYEKLKSDLLVKGDKILKKNQITTFSMTGTINH